LCGCDPQTIKRALARVAAGGVAPARPEPARTSDVVREVVVAATRRGGGGLGPICAVCPGCGADLKGRSPRQDAKALLYNAPGRR
jgi:hypothetical protein